MYSDCPYEVHSTLGHLDLTCLIWWAWDIFDRLPLLVWIVMGLAALTSMGLLSLMYLRWRDEK